MMNQKMRKRGDVHHHPNPEVGNVKLLLDGRFHHENPLCNPFKMVGHNMRVPLFMMTSFLKLNVNMIF